MRTGAGPQGEDLAISFLQDQGLKIVERNWRAGRNGEIDIIGYDGEVLVFVEVKTRNKRAIGRPVQAITSAKRRQLSRLATEYLYHRGLYNQVDCRFDVIGIEFGHGQHLVEHIRDAFRA